MIVRCVTWFLDFGGSCIKCVEWSFAQSLWRDFPYHQCLILKQDTLLMLMPPLNLWVAKHSDWFRSRVTVIFIVTAVLAAHCYSKALLANPGGGSTDFGNLMNLSPNTPRQWMKMKKGYHDTLNDSEADTAHVAKLMMTWHDGLCRFRMNWYVQACTFIWFEFLGVPIQYSSSWFVT